MPELTIIIADDHPLFRGALKQAVVTIGCHCQIIEAGTFEDAKSVAAYNPEADVLLLDLAMPGVSGFSGLMSMRAMHANLPIIVVSATDDGATVRRSIELGASGFISKSSGIDEIRSAVRAVLRGEIWTSNTHGMEPEGDHDVAELINRLKSLTPQQSRVLAMLAEGLLNKQIAYELNVSEATIKAHVSAILLKMKVDSRTQAVIQLAKINAPTMVA
jgi:DNA-binding NarL/FixJ family response regulator